MNITLKFDGSKVIPLNVEAEQVAESSSRFAWAEGHLSIDGHLARATSGDGGAELALDRWMKSGIESVCDAVSGEFALALGDRNRCILVGDTVNMVPLYWATARLRDGGVLLSIGTNCADVDATLREAGIRSEPCRTYLSAFVADMYENLWDQPLTPLMEISRVPGGHFVEIDLSTLRVRTTRYWRRDAMQLDMTPGQALEALDEAWETSVRECFAHGDVAISLSGGTDSSVVMAYAARIAPKRTHCLTVGLSKFPHTQEVDYARANAAAAGVGLHVVDCGQSLPYRLLNPQTMYRYGLPINIFVEQEHLMADKARSLGAAVMLDGVGGDELFGWHSPAYLLDLWRQGRIRQSVSECFACSRKEGDSPLAVIKAARRARRWNPAPAPPWSKESRTIPPDPGGGIRTSLMGRLRTEAQSVLRTENWWNRDAVYTPRGMRILHPICARRIVELTYALPQCVLQNPREYKWLERQLARSRFPYLRFRPDNGDYSAVIYEGLKVQSDRLGGYFGDDCRLVRTGIATDEVRDFVRGYLRDPRTSEECVGQRGYLGRNALCAEMWLRGYEEAL